LISVELPSPTCAPADVAALRDYYGLEKRLVRIHEPFHSLGLIEDDLFEAMGLDVGRVFPRNTTRGFSVDRWKPWKFNGLDVLVGENFNPMIYPEESSPKCSVESHSSRYLVLVVG
jgi:hypothetical protein